MIQVRLRGKPPEPTEAWDAAHRLGQRVIDRHALALCEVTVNANRRRLLAWRITSISAHISAHWALIPHTDEVLAVLDQVPGAWEKLHQRMPEAPAPVLQPVGHVHDLQAIARAEAVRVPDAPPVDITWGQWPNRAPRRTLRLGSCDGTLIRVHPVLDHTSVPSWYVGFIVFHELLHAAMPTKVVGGRRRIHPPLFRRREAEHPHYQASLNWEKRHLARLLDRVAAHVGR